MAKKVAQKVSKAKPPKSGGRTVARPSAVKAKPAAARAPKGAARKATKAPSAAARREPVAKAKGTGLKVLHRPLPPTRTVAEKRRSAPPVEAPRVEVVAQSLADGELEEFRNMLLQKRAEIMGDVSTLQNEAMNSNRREAAGDLSSMPIHMADLGSDNYELEFTLGLIEGERAILKEIDEALERIRNRTYGACLATGRPIGKARLRAKPWAKFCYEYTLAQEKGRAREP